MSEYSSNLFVKGESNNCWAILFDAVKKGSRVLDVGCSSGNFGEVLIKEKSCEVIGVDINKDDINLAKKKLSKAEVMDVERDDLSKLGKFDAIVVADVLEHLANPIEALKSLKKNLKPHGTILFSIPNMAHITTRLRLLEGEFRYTPTGILDNTHLHYYDESEVLHIFTVAQLKIVEMKPTTLVFDDKIINNRLENIGLKASNKFFKHLDETKANIYQFVGIAKPDTKVRLQEPKYVMPVDELRDETKRLEQLTNSHINNLNYQIKEQEHAIEELRAQIQDIKTSKTYKFSEKIMNLKRFFLGEK